MVNFKQWLSEYAPPTQAAQTMGQPTGPKPETQDKIATGLVAKDMSQNTNFLPAMANAANKQQKLGLITKQAGNIIQRNPSPIKAAGIQPDLLNQKLAGVAGEDIKRFFMKKQMGKK